MAAGSLNEVGVFDLRRKRRFDDDDDAMSDHELYSTKRRNLHILPIRSPAAPTIAITPAYGIPPGTLTPDSLPDDSGFAGVNRDIDTRTDRNRDVATVKQSNGLSIDVGLASPGTDMDMSPNEPSHQPLTPIRMGRARSNDLMSPVRSPMTALLPSPTLRTFARNRIPTPVASTFSVSPFESSFASAASRQLRPHVLQQSTSLSPMVDAESWTPQIHRPATPDQDVNDAFSDDDTTMAGVDDYAMSDSFERMSVHSQDNDNIIPSLADSSPSRSTSSHSSRARGLGLAGTGPIRPDVLRMSTINELHRPATANPSLGMSQHARNQSTGRVAKLHMGFRMDCEKCIARVPGHYSHIIWS